MPSEGMGVGCDPASCGGGREGGREGGRTPSGGVVAGGRLLWRRIVGWSEGMAGSWLGVGGTKLAARAAAGGVDGLRGGGVEAGRGASAPTGAPPKACRWG